MSWWVAFWAACGHFFGLDNGSGGYYLFWSGIGSDLGELTLVTAVVVFYRHHTCHVDHCWRLAKMAHEQGGATYQLCRKHHPKATTKLRAEGIISVAPSARPTRRR